MLKFKFKLNENEVPSCIPLVTNFLYVGNFIPVSLGIKLLSGLSKNEIP